jgi:galactose-1-phosphate uridylyltransferase, family 1
MPELRQNIATREWVIIATERARRPEEFVQPATENLEERPAYSDSCPFCPGNEEMDLEQLRLPASGDWQLRVVKNRYPALQEEGIRHEIDYGMYNAISGVGHHEVIIESRLHNTCPALETVEEVERTLLAFKLRGALIQEDRRIEQIIYFKNHGLTAGASLVHPHTQLIALPVVPYNILQRVNEQLHYYNAHRECVICRMVREEAAAGMRVVAESEHFIAFIPFAAYSPFHLWIVPRRHMGNYLDINDEELRDLSVQLRTVLRRIYIGLNNPDYNYVIRTAPVTMSRNNYMHWYVTIIPRVMRSAGFEMGSGMFINTALPEESARFLREVVLPPE